MNVGWLVNLLEHNIIVINDKVTKIVRIGINRSKSIPIYIRGIKITQQNNIGCRNEGAEVQVEILNIITQRLITGVLYYVLNNVKGIPDFKNVVMLH